MSVTAAKEAAGELAAAVALVQLPSRIPPPGALRCSHVHYLGPGNRDEEHVIHDGGKHLSVGDIVAFPGIWEGETDKTPAGGRYVVRGFEVHVEDLLVYATAHWEASLDIISLPSGSRAAWSDPGMTVVSRD